jgi:hypothetical protein
VVKPLWMGLLLAAVGGSVPEQDRPPARWTTLDLAAVDLHGVHIDVPEDVQVAARRSAFGKVVYFRLHFGGGAHDYAVVDDGGFAPPESVQYEDARAVESLGRIVKEEKTDTGWLIVNEPKASRGAVCRFVRSRRLNVKTSRNSGVYCASAGCAPLEVANVIEHSCRTIRAPEDAQD